MQMSILESISQQHKGLCLSFKMGSAFPSYSFKQCMLHFVIKATLLLLSHIAFVSLYGFYLPALHIGKLIDLD